MFMMVRMLLTQENNWVVSTLLLMSMIAKTLFGLSSILNQDSKDLLWYIELSSAQLKDSWQS